MLSLRAILFLTAANSKGDALPTPPGHHGIKREQRTGYFNDSLKFLHGIVAQARGAMSGHKAK
jgi:hypothetical protein